MITSADRWLSDRVLVDDADAERYVRLGYWSPVETVSSLLSRNAAEFAVRVAVVDDAGRSLTYGDLDAAATHLGSALRSRGIERGDVVGMQIPNRVESAIISFGIERAGGVVCPLAPILRERELTHVAQKCEMKALFCPGTYRGYDHDELSVRVSRAVPSLGTIVSLTEETRSAEVTAFEQLMAEDEDDICDPLHPNDPAVVLFSSGTEAEPKGAVHTNNTTLAKCRAITRALSLGETDNIFMASPVAHGTGYVYGLRLALWLGSRLVFMDKWNPAAAAHMLVEHSCGYTHGATPFVKELLAAAPALDFSRFRFFVTGGVSVPDGYVQLVKERLGAELLRMYGQTEAGTMTVHRPWDDRSKHATSEGLPLPGVELKVIGDDGEELARGTAGEAVSRSPLRCVGFLHDRARALSTLTADGFMRTGDVVKMDEEGYVTFLSRKKEIINRGGYKYSPREVEDVLETYPGISRAAVVAMPDSRLGERACLFAIPMPSVSLDLDQVVGFLEQQGVARFKWPERLEIVDELPTTPAGKVQKFLLQARIAESL